MTENDFVIVTSLARVRMIQSLLMGLYAAEDGPVTVASRRRVAAQVDRWERKLDRLVSQSRDEEEEP